MKEANIFLKTKFIPSYWNKKITVMPVETTCEYTKVKDKKKLTSVFNIKEYRKINKDHTFSYKGEDYSIVSKLKNSLI